LTRQRLAGGEGLEIAAKTTDLVPDERESVNLLGIDPVGLRRAWDTNPNPRRLAENPRIAELVPA
jgi:hypothetical protein